MPVFDCLLCRWTSGERLSRARQSMNRDLSRYVTPAFLRAALSQKARLISIAFAVDRVSSTNSLPFHYPASQSSPVIPTRSDDVVHNRVRRRVAYARCVRAYPRFRARSGNLEFPIRNQQSRFEPTRRDNCRCREAFGDGSCIPKRNSV